MRHTKSSETHEPKEPTENRTTLAIVTRVAEANGCRPTELEPLSRVTDPEAIENLLRAENAEFELRFDYEGGQVTVTSDGDVEFELDAESRD
ncbi:hypothetical protein SAMN04487947_1672 [Halogeometricum rufum]|jgi:hypothetical protein|uniref:Halobacterial output domain-containing protein n=1 Tax=Halogeometricum rufum TaxID=553469 RepID=A0A1I6GUQ9_9EURY|nr:HalOD1 output domain-containing protein [Halogeometricum rufum]SFR45856.1 hypothetical protein SAMN04487947_1672 [Halogeometricum rufum]